MDGTFFATTSPINRAFRSTRFVGVPLRTTRISVAIAIHWETGYRENKRARSYSYLKRVPEKTIRLSRHSCTVGGKLAPSRGGIFLVLVLEIASDAGFALGAIRRKFAEVVKEPSDPL